MANKKVSIDLDIEELLGLSEPKKNTLEYDLNFIFENGIEKYNQMQEEHENKKKEFMQLFREVKKWELKKKYVNSALVSDYSILSRHSLGCAFH